jgi:molecular chaperone DnaK (HSP70)
MELIEAIPLSLGIETEDGRFISMISKNTQVPFKETYTFGTSKNNQPAMTFQVFSSCFLIFQTFKFRFMKAKVQLLRIIALSAISRYQILRWVVRKQSVLI